MKPATANISLAIVIRAINTLALARATPVAPDQHAEESIPSVLVNHHILGAVALALAPLSINIPVPAQDTLAAQALPVVVSIPPAPVPAAMNGKMGLVVFPDQFVILVLYIIVIILVHQIKLAVKLCLE